MNVAQEVAVTLSPDLLRHLRAEAKRLGIPLRYLVASLVLDTVDDGSDREDLAIAG